MQATVAFRNVGLAALFAAFTGLPVAQTSTPIAPGLYTLTIETRLPHLEEALRYATVRTTKCLAADSADSFFPVLQHEALSGCTLVATDRADTFALSCRNSEAATGSATFDSSHSGVHATLNLKMGGKNMTLSQRVVGARQGGCK
jgi:Protein of unknown function (DUF3617)